ncbi:MAG: type II secretion system protein [Alphaproteobacteria bacterium]|nr:type II secretion system protein [Alphaproteobacteria bacterium]
MQQIRNQFGRTMVEMLAVLAIIAVITVGAIAGLSQAMQKYRISKFHDDVLAIDNAIVDLYSWQRHYPTLTRQITAELCNNRVFPDGCAKNNTEAYNIFGGNFYITTTSSDVKIIATGIPTAVCTALVEDEEWGEYVAVPASCTNGEFSITFY